MTGLIEDSNMDPAKERKLDDARRAREAKKGGELTTTPFAAVDSKHRVLLEHVLEKMIAHRDWYRAMKYAREWELDDGTPTTW